MIAAGPEKKRVFLKRYGGLALAVAALLTVGYLFREALWDAVTAFYRFLADRKEIQRVVTGFGPLGPVVFIGIQILQVLFAPIPGEATGFIGGFLFGTAKGFFYSSIGLTMGSFLNFQIGRVLGRRYVRKVISDAHLNRFDAFVRHQGVLVVFALFLIPGFPKDLLSLFLGVTTMPLKAFVLLAALGRMPGTLMLSLQGAFLYEKMYGPLVGVLGVSVLFVVLAFRFREKIYRWIETLNSGT